MDHIAPDLERCHRSAGESPGCAPPLADILAPLVRSPSPCASGPCTVEPDLRFGRVPAARICPARVCWSCNRACGERVRLQEVPGPMSRTIGTASEPGAAHRSMPGRNRFRTGPLWGSVGGPPPARLQPRVFPRSSRVILSRSQPRRTRQPSAARNRQAASGQAQGFRQHAGAPDRAERYRGPDGPAWTQGGLQ